MGAAWEWRAFQPGASGSHSRSQGGWPDRLRNAPVEWWQEEDTYLVLPGLRHNLKLRSGVLEIKRWLQDQPGGYALWHDKEQWPFPLSREQCRMLMPILTGEVGRAPGLESAADLIRWLRTGATGLGVWVVQKERSRLQVDGARVELARLRLPGVGRWHSICVDGYDLAAARHLVQEWHLDRWGRPLDYVAWLAELEWWLAGLSAPGEVAGTGTQPAR